MINRKSKKLFERKSLNLSSNHENSYDFRMAKFISPNKSVELIKMDYYQDKTNFAYINKAEMNTINETVSKSKNVFDRLFSLRKPEYQLELSFTPKINNRSLQIIRSKSRKTSKKEKSNELFLNSFNSNRKINKEYKLQEIVDKKECTFHPNILNHFNQKNIKIPFEKRIMEWKEKIDEKIKKKIDDKMMQKDEECIFFPKVTRYIPHKEIVENNEKNESIEKFLERRTKILSRKKELEDKFDNIPGSGKLWKDRITIPNDNHFKYSQQKKDLINKKADRNQFLYYKYFN